VRLFVALIPPPAVRTRLAAALPPLPAGHQFRPVPPDRWHVTLAFLGEVPDDAPLRPPLTAAATATGPLALTVTGAATFPSALYLGVDGPGLADLAARVRDELLAAGQPAGDRRRWRGHLTIARGRAVRMVPGLPRVPVAWRAHRMSLVHSQPGPEAAYTERAGWSLGAVAVGSA
jgi:RNA 2',3'-cyclic 3'-phosphodiesterase